MVNINKDLLLLGEPYQINSYLKIRHPTLREIIKLDGKYHEYCDQFVFNTQDYIVELDKIGIKYFEITTYDVFIKNYEVELYYNQNSIKNSLNWWLEGDYNFQIIKHNNSPTLYDSEKKIIFDLLAYDKMSDYIKTINNIPLDNLNINPNKGVYNMILMKSKQKIKKLLKKQNKTKQYDGFLHELINSIAWVNYGVNIFDIWDLKIYQFYRAISKIQQIKHIDGLTIGIMTGNIDAKKNKIDTEWLTDKKEKINWIDN